MPKMLPRTSKLCKFASIFLRKIERAAKFNNAPQRQTAKMPQIYGMQQMCHVIPTFVLFFLLFSRPLF